MEDKKFERYYFLISSYSISATNNQNSKEKRGEEGDDDESFDTEIFLYDSPMEIRVLMKYLRFIVKQMYQALGTKKNVEEAIEEIKSEKIKEKKYNWKDIYLEDLFNADFYYLKKYFILNDLVPDEKTFINNYSRTDYNLTYPFSLKELYHFFLRKGIEILIDNYSCLEKK